MKTKIFILMMALCFGMKALPEGRIGNGGGGWVCRDRNKVIRWVNTVDLLNAVGKQGLILYPFPGDYVSIVDQVQNRLALVLPAFQVALKPYLSKIDYLRPNPSSVIYTVKPLPLTDDLGPEAYIPINECAVATGSISSWFGNLSYEQLADFVDGSHIFVRSDFWLGLSEINKAALVTHEAIYWMMRDRYGDIVSLRSRKINGLLFSTLSNEEIAVRIRELLQTGP